MAFAFHRSGAWRIGLSSRVYSRSLAPAPRWPCTPCRISRRRAVPAAGRFSPNKRIRSVTWRISTISRPALACRSSPARLPVSSGSSPRSSSAPPINPTRSTRRRTAAGCRPELPASQSSDPCPGRSRTAPQPPPWHASVERGPGGQIPIRRES